MNSLRCPPSLPLIRRTIRGIDYKRAVALAQTVLKFSQPAEIIACLQEVTREVFGEDPMFHSFGVR